jgi:hypothetical protein
MRIALLLISTLALAACGSGGPPVPDWKTDSANYIERYKKAYLMGESTLADSFFERAIDATSGAGKVAETARLWLVQCALHKASLAADACERYSEFARTDTTPKDRVYFQFLSAHWTGLDEDAMPSQYRPLIKDVTGDLAKTNEALRSMADPLSRLIAVGVLFERKQVNDATLELAAQTASDQGWRRPLLVYLKLQETRASERGDTAAKDRLAVRIRLVETALAQPK